MQETQTSTAVCRAPQGGGVPPNKSGVSRWVIGTCKGRLDSSCMKRDQGVSGGSGRAPAALDSMLCTHSGKDVRDMLKSCRAGESSRCGTPARRWGSWRKQGSRREGAELSVQAATCRCVKHTCPVPAVLGRVGPWALEKTQWLPLSSLRGPVGISPAEGRWAQCMLPQVPQHAPELQAPRAFLEGNTGPSPPHPVSAAAAQPGGHNWGSAGGQASSPPPAASTLSPTAQQPPSPGSAPPASGERLAPHQHLHLLILHLASLPGGPNR